MTETKTIQNIPYGKLRKGDVHFIERRMTRDGIDDPSISPNDLYFWIETVSSNLPSSVLMPDDMEMELRRFELVVYIDSTGREQIDWRWSGEEVSAMAAMGYIEAAQLAMYHTQLHAETDEEN